MVMLGMQVGVRAVRGAAGVMVVEGLPCTGKREHNGGEPAGVTGGALTALKNRAKSARLAG
jgi:hypothetical protein